MIRHRRACAHIDVAGRSRRRSITGEVHRNDARLFVFQVHRRLFGELAVDRAAEVDRLLPAEVVMLVRPPGHPKIVKAPSRPGEGRPI